MVDWGRLGVVRCRSWGMVRSRGRLGVIRSWGRVVRSRFGVVGFVMGFTLVSDISDVAVFMIGMVGHNLHTTVGKSNFVFTRNNTVIILSFSLAEVSSRVFIVDTVFVGERPRGEFVGGFRVVWCRLGGMIRCGFRCRGMIGSWGRVIRSWGGVIRGRSRVVRSWVVRGVIGDGQSQAGD